MASYPIRTKARDAALQAESEANDLFRFNILRDGPIIQNLGAGNDRVVIGSGPSVSQIRLTLTRFEVGNGNPNDSNMMPNQDGGLAIRLQAENGAGALFGPVSRFDDEGITFRTVSETVKFDIRDVSGAESGNTFDVVTLGTSGADTYDYSGQSEFFYINTGLGDDRITGGRGDDHPVGGAGNDIIRGGGGDDLIVGAPGNDRISGGGGNDRAIYIAGADGADSVNLGAGNDTVILLGAPGQVRITFTSAEVGNGHARDGGSMTNQDAGLAVRMQAESAGALTGPVSRYDDEGISFLAAPGMTFDVRDLVSGAARGSRFEVVRLGTSGNDAIDDSASARPTYINAGMGDDELIGGTRSDFLVGGGGDDRLSGGRGSDSLLGGLGGDTFAFSGSPGTDRILDFASGADRIDLSAYGIDIGDVETSASGANTLIDVDRDSDGAFDFQILLVNAAAPVAADFIF